MNKMDKSQFDTYVELATGHIKRGEFDDAEKYANSALSMDSQSPQVHNILGTIYLEESKYDSAEIEFTQAINLAPRFWKPHYNLALLNQKRGNRTATLRKSLDTFLSSPNLETLSLSTEIIIRQYQKPSGYIAAVCFILPFIFQYWVSLFFTIVLSVFCYAITSSYLRYQNKRKATEVATMWMISVILHLIVIFS